MSGGRGNLFDLRIIFYFDRSVPADEEVTSLTAPDLDAQGAPITPATTHWSVVLEAQGLPCNRLQEAQKKLRILLPFGKSAAVKSAAAKKNG